MRNALLFLLCAAVLGSILGCGPRFGLPALFDPGPAEVQQRRAQRWDPFPEPDIGPEVEGARPRDFQEPMSEAERSRQERPLWQKTGRLSPIPVR